MGHDPSLLKFLMNPLNIILVFHHSHMYREWKKTGPTQPAVTCLDPQLSCTTSTKATATCLTRSQHECGDWNHVRIIDQYLELVKWSCQFKSYETGTCGGGLFTVFNFSVQKWNFHAFSIGHPMSTEIF